MNKWDQRFLDLARHVATWSKDPGTKVGAVIVRPDKTVASVGYNGFPRGVEDDQVALDDRENKLSRTVHAEMNAILNCADRPAGYTLYVWPMAPCDRCSPHIIQAGISRVVSPANPPERWRTSIHKGRDIMTNAGLQVEEVGNG